MGDARGVDARLRGALGRAAALVGGTAAGLLLAELLTGLVAPVPIGPADYFDDFFVPDGELGYRMRPGFDGAYVQDYAVALRANAQGLRDRDYGPAAPGTLRVLAVGDSYTFGAGVAEEAAWPRQLEGALRDAGVPAEVINAGTSGYGTLQYLGVVRRLLPVYQPDVVVVMVTYNDPGNDLATRAGAFPSLKVHQSPARRWLKRHSDVAKHLWRAWLTWRVPALSFADADALYRDAEAEGPAGERSRRGFALFDAALADIAGETRAAGAALLCAASSEAGHVVAARAAADCERAGARFVDVFSGRTWADVRDVFRGRNSAGHWSPDGHRAVARALAPAVVAAAGTRRERSAR